MHRPLKIRDKQRKYTRQYGDHLIAMGLTPGPRLKELLGLKPGGDFREYIIGFADALSLDHKRWEI